MRLKSIITESWKRRLRRILCLVMALLLAVLPCTDAKAVTYYESDGANYEEGYIFVGESHMGIASTHILDDTDHSGAIPGLDNVSYQLDWDGSLYGNYTMKGNLFFVFGGLNAQNEAATQTSREYIYSDGQGKQGLAVIRIHEIIDKNPGIAHWNIISYHGSVQARDMEGRSVPDYYVASYRNWMEHEFPQADIYFLSLSTMTKYYRAAKNPELFNQIIKEAFPDNFLDYTDFYNQRYPQEMMDPTMRSDTIHWNPKTYTEMIVSVIQEIQLRREIAKQAEMVSVTVEVTVADVDAVLYTNENTVIFDQPDWNAQMLFPVVEAGLPIHVTGITDNGFFRVDLGEMAAYIHGSGLNE